MALISNTEIPYLYFLFKKDEIRKTFLEWMQTKSPAYLDQFSLDLVGKWLTERGLSADEKTLYALDEFLAEIKWEYIKGVCHEQ